MQNNRYLHRLLNLSLAAIVSVGVLLPMGALAQDATVPAPPATIVDDEGGPVVITGAVNYTDPFFTMGVASPMVILEDQAGFVDRNERFIMPEASQTIGQITSDFFESPFTYSLALPIVPQGTLRDVDNNGAEDTGVMTFAIAYWTNTFGDPFLEVRDLYGGGWSTAYASTRVSEDWETRREVTGGKFLVYAPDDQQGFPSGFGDDGLLFTADDPIVTLPQGYTIVDMDTAPFTFSRPAEAVVDLIEPEGSALADYSQQSYAEAFTSLVEKMRKEYAFSEAKNIDWDALLARYLPRFERADANNSATEYEAALREFSWEIPDGHVNAGVPPGEEFQKIVSGGLGMGIRDVDTGETIVNYLTDGGPAAEAGIEPGAQIIALDGTPINQYVEETTAWSGPFSTAHNDRLQKLRYATRFPVGTDVEVTYQNPGSKSEETVTLTAVGEMESFSQSSFYSGSTGYELPVEYHPIDGTDYVYARITDFADNSVLTVQLWERMIQSLNSNGVPGVVVDMRQNGGGAGFLADQMAAYFFEDELKLGNTGFYDKSLDEFKFDPRNQDQFYLPDSSLRYDGKVAVLVGPACASACEFFSYDMTLDDRAAIVGQYPTAGLGGSVNDVKMPEDLFFRMTVGRAVNEDGEIHIEGQGVAPTVQVPVTLETLTSDGDPVLDAAVAWLDGATTVATEDGGAIAVGESVDGTLTPGSRTQYALDVNEGDKVNITATDENGELDTVLRLYIEGELVYEQDESADGGPNAEITDLDIPADLTLTVEVAGAGDVLEGAYILEVSDAN
jgi:C-terminal processing protease CtpA/Prc